MLLLIERWTDQLDKCLKELCHQVDQASEVRPKAASMLDLDKIDKEISEKLVSAVVSYGYLSESGMLHNDLKPSCVQSPLITTLLCSPLTLSSWQ